MKTDKQYLNRARTIVLFLFIFEQILGQVLQYFRPLLFTDSEHNISNWFWFILSSIFWFFAAILLLGYAIRGCVKLMKSSDINELYDDDNY